MKARINSLLVLQPGSLQGMYQTEVLLEHVVFVDMLTKLEKLFINSKLLEKWEHRGTKPMVEPLLERSRCTKLSDFCLQAVE